MRQASARAATGESPGPAYYEWKVPGNPLSVHISFAVIDQLEAEIMKGFRSVPKRGAEVGGVLFGRVVPAGEATTVYIDDHEPVSCEYRRGPSYVLSETDRKRLERTLRRGDAERQVVGFYRSHTRLGLYLDQDDHALIQSCFANPNHVILLVRPHASKTSVGGFFFWEEGAIHRQSTYLEFPFATAEILNRQPGAEPQPEPAPVAAPPPAPAAYAAPAAATVRVRLRLPRLNRRALATAAALLLLLVFAEYLFLRRLARPTPAAADYSPVLRVERDGRSLQVDWSRSSPSVLNADRGLLVITDGAARKELHFDAAQLRAGTVAYSPTGNDISFRLELTGGRTTVSESLRVVAAPPPAPAPAAMAVIRPEPKPSAPPTRQAKVRRRRAFVDDGL